MAGVYTEFLSFLNRYGVAKTSHFRLFVPQVFKGDKFSDIGRVLGLRCEATELPGRQLVSNDSRTYGPTYKTPYQSLYQEITLNFIETGDFLIRNFFEAWVSAIYNPLNNQLAYPSEYRRDVELTQYDVMVLDATSPRSSLRSIATWQLRNAFPTSINQMPVSWAEDGLHRCTVTLAYEWYDLIPGDKPVTPTVGSAPVPPRGSANT